LRFPGIAATVAPNEASIFGSAREFDEVAISRGFPQNDEFGFGRGEALRLQQQIARFL
jgi:hypothetical protein